MKTTIAGLLGLIVFASGCSLCPPGYLDDYATVGGKWQRTDPSCGRVGSIFSDPGSTVHDISMNGDEYYESDLGGAQSYGNEVYDEGAYYEEVYPNANPDGAIILGEDF